MPRPVKNQEKPKNFKLAMQKLINSLRKFWPAIILSFILSAVGAVLTIMAPNKLSKLTDELTLGLVPKTEVIANLTELIASDLNEEQLQIKFKEILSLNISEKNIKKILTSNDFTAEEKLAFQEALGKLKTTDNPIAVLKEIPENILSSILEETIYKGVHISVNDKLALIKTLTTDNIDFKQIPESILKVVFSEKDYDGVYLSSVDQAKVLMILSSIKDTNDQDKIFEKIDELPENIYNLVKPEINMHKVKSIVLMIACLYGFNALFTYIEGLLMVHVTINYSKDTRNKISRKINKLPLKYFDKHTIGDTLSRVTNDVDTVSQSMHQSFSTIVSAIAMFFGSIIMMFYTNYIMAITAIISSLLGFILMFMILGKSQKYFSQRQKELGNINGHIEEIFSGHNVVTLYNGKRIADETFDDLNEKVYNCERKSQFLSGLMHPIMGFIGNFGYVAVCIVGAILTFNDVISFGVIVAFIIYVRLFTNPLSQIAQSMTSFQSMAAASERVFEFLEEVEMEDESHKTKYLQTNEVKGEIEFDHVKFGYDKDKVIIKDFNAHILPGQKVAIVGPTGAGKTTLVNLLMKFYELNSGDIKIDGVSTKELTRDNIHKLFIMVLQDTWLFQGTVKENICFNKKNVSEEKIKEVCKTVGILHYIKTLPNGFDSILDDTNSISSGQKQLLTIARGMIEDAPFLILDEATSNVDTRTEELVQKAMDKLTEGRTSFIIAHRLSTIKNADLILVMNEGNIIEQGNHEELMKKNGFYANLYNSQFEKLS